MFKRKYYWALWIPIILLTPLLLLSCYTFADSAPPDFEEEFLLQETIPEETEPLVCKHKWKDGCCIYCGEKCQHKYIDGICQICSYECPHTVHDQNLICQECGATVYHQYKDNKCEICGKQRILMEQMIDTEWLMSCEHQGQVEIVSLPASDEPKARLAQMAVYTPYGYDESKQYDVVLLLHGDGGSMYNWTNTKHMHGGLQWSLSNLYDNMIDKKFCKPVIVVAPNYLDGALRTDYEGFAEDLKNIVLPWIAENYATYAKDGSYESLKEARDHLCLGGLSRGAMYAYNSMLPRCLDVCSNYIILSISCYNASIYPYINDYDGDIRYMYFGIGSGDAVPGMRKMYDGLIENTDKFVDGENCQFDILQYLGHYWATWTTNFFNAIQFIFPEE